jgi:hypothetical protein
MLLRKCDIYLQVHTALVSRRLTPILTALGTSNLVLLVVFVKTANMAISHVCVHFVGSLPVVTRFCVMDRK